MLHNPAEFRLPPFGSSEPTLCKYIMIYTNV